MVFETPKTPAHSAHARRIPFVAGIIAHAESENHLRPSPFRSATLTPYLVRCAPPSGIPIFFGVEKYIPPPGPPRTKQTIIQKPVSVNRFVAAVFPPACLLM
jgi:hypothetical protein